MDERREPTPAATLAGERRRYDVVVIGAGPAGLSGALTLARARRSVLVVDAGRPRNAPAAQVHGYLGREGTSPAQLLAEGRKEVTGYGTEIIEGSVVTARRLDNGDFRVVLADGSAAVAGRLLVATGLVDELPQIPGLARRWGREVLHCPYCHGWEVRDQAIAILSTGTPAIHQALLWRQWSRQVTLFLHTGPEPGDEEYEQLAAREIAVVDGRVTDLVVTGDRLTGVTLAGGRVIPCRALVVPPHMTARAALLTDLGLEPAEQHRQGHVLGSHIAADPYGATEVPGVWVAGNVTDLTDQVIAAAAAGVRTGAAINADLVEEDTRRAVAARRAVFSPQLEREACERVLGDSRHGLDPTQTAPPDRRPTRRTGENGHEKEAPMTEDLTGVSAEEHWDARYAESDRIWSGKPNTALVREVTGMEPGRALDLGCGEGADAIWLARQGWRVTATDVSRIALGRAARHAATAGVAGRIDWQWHDLAVSFPTSPTGPTGTFDLISACFLHSLVDLPRERILRTAAAAVAPGGVLLVVGHAGHPPWEHAPHPGVHLPTPAELLDALDLPPGEWELERSEEHQRSQTGPDGLPATRTDNTLRVRRRTSRT